MMDEYRVSTNQLDRWSKYDMTGSVNAIENSLYMKATAQLAELRESDADFDYAAEARAVWAWFMNKGLVDATTGVVYDGLDDDSCQVEGSSHAWTYNTGVFISALAYLAKASPGDAAAAIRQADESALGAMKFFATEPGQAMSTVRESCEPNCDDNSAQFKGILAACIMEHYLVSSPRDELRRWLQGNANTLIYTAKNNVTNQLGESWSNDVPLDFASTMQETSSGLEVLIGAACVSV